MWTFYVLIYLLCVDFSLSVKSINIVMNVMLFPLPITILVIFQYWANKTCSNRRRKQYTSFPVKVDTVLKSEAH